MLLDFPVGPTEVRFYLDIEEHIIIVGERRSMCDLEPPVFVSKRKEPDPEHDACVRCQQTVDMTMRVKLVEGTGPMLQFDERKETPENGS